MTNANLTIAVDQKERTEFHEDPVAERRSVDGRIVFVLDPLRLVARAGQLIENSFGRSDPS